MNNNVLNAAAANVGYWTSAQTFAGWQTASASDAASLSGITVTYMNSANNLHLNMGLTPTMIESGAQVIPAVTIDIDNDARPGPVGSVNGGGIFPDIGADEFDGVPLDAIPPTITYTALTFTCSTSDRTFTATISDVSGVPTSGIFQPRVYFQKNAAGWNSTQGVLTSGTGQNGTWTFTISTAAMGGLAIGDVVSYYVIAQDIVAPTPNIRSNPSAGLVASNVNTVTTPPTSPNSYPISSTLSGTYTVGAAGNFTTLTAAVAAYNNSCIGGAIVFSLIDPTYPSETFPITIAANPNASAVNTLTIQPATGNAATITGSTTTGIIILNGADFVTINGTNSSTVNSVCPLVSASRDLTISNTNVSAASGVVWMSTTASLDAVTNCTVQNCIIAGNASTTTLIGVGSGGVAIGSSGNSNNNISFINNDIRACQYGIYSGGASAAVKNQNLTINQNFINNTSPNNVGLAGIVANLTNNITVSANAVGNITNAAASDVVAINIGFGAVGGFSATLTGIADGASNVTITNNTIGIVQQTGTFSAVGIGLGNTISGTNLIANNMVAGVNANATAGDISAGIILGGGTVQTNVYHNTVCMQGVISGASAASQTSACFAVTSAVTTPLDIRNNIFINKQIGNAGATLRFTTIALGYSSTVGNYASLVSDYNDLFSAGAGPGTYHVGITGGMVAGTSRTTLANWQTETGRDANSSNVAATFVSAPDLHAIAGSNPGIEDAGTPISVTSDIDCAIRSTCTPDMGADEFGTPREIEVQGNSITITDGDITPSATDFTDLGTQSVCNGILTSTFTIQNLGTTTLTIGSVTITGANAPDFTVTTNPAASIAGSGSTTFVVTFDPSVTGVENATITINNNDCDEAIYDFAIQGTGTQIAASSAAQTDVTCNGGNDGSATVATTGGIAPITYAWTPSGGTAPTASGLTAGSYTCTVADANGCVATQTFTITEPPILIVTASASPSTICSGSSTTLTATGASTYNWMPGNLSGASVSDSPTATTTYTVTGTSAVGCVGTETVTVTVNPLPTVTANATANAVCAGSSVTLTGGGATSYTWTGGVNDGVSFVPASTLSYTVTGTDVNGCSNTANVTVIVNPLPTVNLGSDITQCGGTVILDAQNAGSTYLWNDNSTSQTLTASSSGIYWVDVTDAFGCTSRDSLTATVNTPPTVTFTLSLDTVCLNGGNFALTGESPVGGVWSGNGVTGSSLDPLVAGVGVDSITYMYTDVNGCSGSSTQAVVIDLCNDVNGFVFENGNISAYPNPNNGTFTISISNVYGEGVLEITDALGQVVYSENLSATNNSLVKSIELGTQANGIYFVRFTSSSSSAIQKIIIQK
jgi:hypothetical protein